MMVNRHRGEVAARLDGRDWTLCLTLGALAELEAAFEADNLSDLIARFSSGRLSARDMQRIICAGLRGGGHNVSDDDVADMRADGGATGYARMVSELLTATFGGAETKESHSAPNP
ncbi:gene transfer agent family protein [Falsochrobactrum ovis]|uniref:Tail tube GTA-gp10-like protein n=1 Tax=Falsochrobactrum ovis TaxID=1293442 RepID=A0A364K0B5_9HYPH|nr:gene transfer agent family protein [Falsochrobactrum ovis]RAK34370.1 tail tube GTA-gp10-like protein [Falsochrobactrum ovis]